MGQHLLLSKGCNRGFPDGSAVKKPPANVQSPGWEDPLEEEMTTHSHILASEIPWTGSWQAIVHGVTKSQT